MSDREVIQALKASHSGFKATLTRARNIAESSQGEYVVGDDPILLENFLGLWVNCLQKYLDAEDQFNCGIVSNVKDCDLAGDRHVKAVSKAKFTTIGFHRDVEANAIRLSDANESTLSPDSRQAHPQVLKTDAKKPPVLVEDVNYKEFTRWRPLWNNYSQLVWYMDQHESQSKWVSFGNAEVPGFMQLVHHSIGIEPETGRTMDEILDLFQDHLRTLRNVHLHMLDVLTVRQQEGQSYTSFCTSLRELDDFADSSSTTEDRLLIALLLLRMRSETDRTKVMEKNPTTFNKARKLIIEAETNRLGACNFSIASSFQAVNVIGQIPEPDLNASVAKKSTRDIKGNNVEATCPQ